MQFSLSLLKSSSYLTSSSPFSDCNKDPPPRVGVSSGASTGGGSAGGSGAGKTAASGVALLLIDTGRSILSLRAASFKPLVFYFSVPIFVSVNVFAFCEASTSNAFF